MGHSHGHDHHHDHDHDHDHGHGSAHPTPEAVDTSIPDSELSPRDLSRRTLLRNAGLLGAGAGAMSVFGTGVGTAAAASGGKAKAVEDDELTYVAGDHHIHTQFSSDGMYRVEDQARRAAEYGLDWMVVTDHGSAAHAKIGVEKVNPEIVASREANPRTLVFQGLEWNIPAAEHGTVFVAPGPNEVAVLKEFENTFDGSVTGTSSGVPGAPTTPAREALAITGIQWMAQQKQAGRVQDAIMFANHPARLGIDSPHEIRGWRDAAPGIFTGFEGAPGHQAAQLEGGARGAYGNSPGAASFPAYPLASYRTHGGFDWMTATVGGLWDSLLAEGRPWWITANSDSHSNYGDRLVRGAFGPGEDFNTLGQYNDPIDSGVPQLDRSDFWPGQYSRTHVGVSRFGYLDVMSGLRAGRIWVDHGQLIDGIDVRLRLRGSEQRTATLGGVLTVPRGSRVDLEVTIDLASRPNLAGEMPRLRRVDAIAGAVTGLSTDKDSFRAPQTTVVESFEVSQASGRVELSMRFRPVEEAFYVRLRGTDANRTGVGFYGASVDPEGPAMDIPGQGSPWEDLWFYTNPIWVNVTP
ncbi:PHP domain-containing protein [Motilibacter deserti]|uniref:PHP domain-containing protein n=1 Tax=Motilibacter deserti TaxID=2714956 RepID=A0ABX0GTW7_9ACTN|nr:PHP domain-containing protein [Motilibacter deserti]NHC13100.1 PHP domain-containing protein [Motilibacter deserti]